MGVAMTFRDWHHRKDIECGEWIEDGTGRDPNLISSRSCMLSVGHDGPHRDEYSQPWPESVSDGLTLPCADCGELPRFDYHVTEEFWRQWVPGPERLGVICLPCLDKRSGGVGLGEALEQIQWTGTGHTVVLTPSLRHNYVAPSSKES